MSEGESETGRGEGGEGDDTERGSREQEVAAERGGRRKGTSCNN